MECVPRYIILSAFVFVPVTDPLLMEPIARKALRSPQVQQALEEFGVASKELVMCSQRFDHEASLGYKCQGELLERFNGLHVKGLVHLSQLIQDCDTEYVELEFGNKSLVVVLRAACKAVEDDVMRQHGIHARSENLSW